jgi:hypothetical protein
LANPFALRYQAAHKTKNDKANIHVVQSSLKCLIRSFAACARNIAFKIMAGESLKWLDAAMTKTVNDYMLYNFKDSPSDLFERMRLNVKLNEELNIRIWSFPMRFQPTDLPNRSHIGDKWSRYQLRSSFLMKSHASSSKKVLNIASFSGLAISLLAR